MISVPPLRDSSGDDRDGDMGNCSMLNSFCDAAWLDMDISFDDLFVELYDEDILPDLEVDPAYKILSEFSVGREEDSEMTTTIEVGAVDATSGTVVPEGEKREEKDLSHGKEAVAVSATKKEEPTSPATDQGQKSCAAAAKGSQGKPKVKKVDWTPQLHRRFVQAVEQLGIDKAVPSRILELMDIDCLTRHNIASHLQKYRSHRKHSLVREAENASWNQRRQKYTASTVTREGGNPWLGTIAFPPPPPPSPVYPFRPLHVWGHPPPADPPLVHVWPRHVTPPWAPRSPLPPNQREGREGWILAHAMAQGTPCLISQPVLPTARSPAPFVAAILPHPMCRAAPPAMSKHSECSQLLLDAHPSKECIDAAIGDVLAKPWSPLPIGLRPPSLESMLVELQKQGVSKVPP